MDARRGSDLDYDLFDGSGPGSGSGSSSSHRDHLIFTIANRILFAKYYYLVYIVLFVAQSVLFIWGLYHHTMFTKITNDDVWYIVLDVFITLLLAAEVIFRIIATHRTYWRSWLNRVDFVLMILCVFALFLYAVDPEAAIVGSAFLAIRYAVQIMRVIITCKHHRERRHMVSAMNGRIAFDAVVEESSAQSGKSGGGRASLLTSPLMEDQSLADAEAALALRDLMPVRSINSRLIRVTDDEREHATLLSMYEEQAEQARKYKYKQSQGQGTTQAGSGSGYIAPNPNPTSTPAPTPTPPNGVVGTSSSPPGPVISPSPSPPVVDDRTVPLSALTHLPSQTSLISHSFYSQMSNHSIDHHDEDDGL